MNVTASIKAVGGPVSIGICFGNASVGNYAVQLFGPNDQTSNSPVNGASTDQQTDLVPLQPAPADLNGRLAGVAVNAVSSSGGWDVVSATVSVLQGGATVLTSSPLRASVNAGQYASFLFFVRFQTT